MFKPWRYKLSLSPFLLDAFLSFRHNMLPQWPQLLPFRLLSFWRVASDQLNTRFLCSFFFTITNLLGRTEIQTRERKKWQLIRTVRVISPRPSSSYIYFLWHSKPYIMDMNAMFCCPIIPTYRSLVRRPGAQGFPLDNSDRSDTHLRLLSVHQRESLYWRLEKFEDAKYVTSSKHKHIQKKAWCWQNNLPLNNVCASLSPFPLL